MSAESYGEYQLIKRLASGGMATIFLARQKGLEGFEKLLVVKRILPHLAENEDFIKMFLDEARIAARLNHPNIVQIYNLGAQDDSYFIAMEYIHGEDVRRIWKKSDQTGKPIPLPLVCRIIMDAAAGLDYAHKKTDQAGKPLGIVHRDVSPQNILVTFEGGVKVVDFGIAKAVDQATVTKSGVLKGKYSYMSPEQADGRKIDRRADIFALGVVLYELLTGERLFKRGNDIQTLNAVSECNVPPPSMVNARVPKTLDPVVMRALERNPEVRYPDAASMQAALEDWLLLNKLPSSSVHLAAFMKDLYRDRLEREAAEGRVLVEELDKSKNPDDPNQKATPGLEGPPKKGSGSHRPAGGSATGAWESGPREPSTKQHDPDATRAERSGEAPQAAYEGASRTGRSQPAVSTIEGPPPFSLLEGGSLTARSKPGPPVAEPGPEGKAQSGAWERKPLDEVSHLSLPISVEPTNDGTNDRTTTAATVTVPDAGPAARFPWGWTLALIVVGAALGALLVLRSTAGAVVHLASEPSGAAVAVDGAPMTGLTTPCSLPKLTMGEHTLTLSKPGYEELTSRFEVQSFGEQALPSFRLVAAPAPLRAPVVPVTLKSDPPGATVTADGKRLPGQTPLTLEMTPGVTVALDLQLPGYRDVSTTLAVSDATEQTITLERAGSDKPEKKRPGAEKKQFGSVQFKVDPWGIVACEGVKIGETPFRPVQLPAGSHACTFTNPELHKTQERVVVVEPNALTKVNVNLEK